MEGLGEVGWGRASGREGVSGDVDGDSAVVIRRLMDQPVVVSSPGFCGGWFIWCRWLLVVIVPGGGGRVPRRLRARRGFACRWRSVAGWCPYQWTHSAVASSAASMSCQGPWPKDELGLVQRVERLGQGEAERESALESTEATASRSDRACP